MKLLRQFLLLVLSCFACPVFADEGPTEFERDVAPIFEQRCLQCHSDNISKGDFSLSTAKELIENEFIVPGDPDSSYLIELISGDQPEMPREGDPLSSAEVATLREWVAGGAAWSEDTVLYEQSKADVSWWSLQPLKTFDPQVTIDGFLQRELQANALAMNGPADRRTLIRRATYDLTGLPPTPSEVDAFVADNSPNAYEKVVDRLLASPGYGQRWGRHWLDVIRFGESTGFEQNVIIDSLWPLRDFVIDSLNADKPFDLLIREHLAGDVLSPGNPDVEIGSAFLVAGPYDGVGNQDAIQAAQIRANTIDEMIRASSEAFLGLTVGCARCHDHKFDAIRQHDYYKLYATFAGVRHGERVIATAAEKAERSAKLEPLTAQTDAFNARLAAINKAVEERAQANAEEHTRAWTRDPVARTGTTERFEPILARHIRLIADGTDSNPKSGRGFRIDELEIWSNGKEPQNVALASGGAVATGASRTIEDFPGAYGPQLAIDGKAGARFISAGNEIRIELPSPTLIDKVVFSSARGELKPDQPKFVCVSDYRIEVSIDGAEWQQIADGSDRQPVNDAHRKHRLYRLAISADQQREIKSLERQIGALKKQINAVPSLRSVWVGQRVAADAQGPFNVFIGGSPQRKGASVVAASLSTLANVAPEYELSESAPEAERRLALANWVVHPKNPLSPRVLANRIWHYHFGTGIVSTPSDFGFMGGLPSHPALLDWLAGKLLHDQWRIKPLHKTIMMSRAYQQSSQYRAEAARADGDARMLWRFPPRRLSAEEIRDTMLFVSNKLDSRLGGPGFRLYDYLRDNVATYVPLDVHAEDTYRRAVYHQNARAARTDLMSDFDAPDCAFSTPRRAITTTPLQALTSLNHSFTLDVAKALAERAVSEAKDDRASRIKRLFLVCFGRLPEQDELVECGQIVQQHGLAALCRVLLNTSELIYVL